AGNDQLPCALIDSHKGKTLAVRRECNSAVDMARQLPNRAGANYGNLVQRPDLILFLANVINIVAVSRKAEALITNVIGRGDHHTASRGHMAKPKTLLAKFVGHVHDVLAVWRNCCISDVPGACQFGVLQILEYRG